MSSCALLVLRTTRGGHEQVGHMRHRSGNVPYVAESFWTHILRPSGLYPQITCPTASWLVVVRTVQVNSHRSGSSSGSSGSGQNSYRPAKPSNGSFSENR